MKELNYLYHGSAFLQDKLSPGILHSGVLVKWDRTESNKWLYTSSCIETATVLGLASAVEKKFDLVSFSNSGDCLRFQFDENKVVTKEDISSLVVYLYKIKYSVNDQWVKVNNLHNGIDNEYKTQQVVSYESVQQLNTDKILEGKQIVINNKPVYSSW